MNGNPVVARGNCRVCGKPVSLFDRDAEEYIAAPYRGLAHFECPDEESFVLSQLPDVPGGDYGNDGRHA